VSTHDKQVVDVLSMGQPEPDLRGGPAADEEPAAEDELADWTQKVVDWYLS